jgi:flavin reductase (DIM6/NTAB) family NADH-FMN oxidoreductase RutF
MEFHDSMTFDQRAFRDAMGCFATGITVVSTMTGDGRPVGMTVNSFSSVSLDPPLVLFSLARTASNYDAFAQAEKFAISVLRDDQRDISQGFASSSNGYFNEITYEETDFGCPLVPDAIAVFECLTEAKHDGGDHVIMVGRVDRVRCMSEGEPLLYYRGRYAEIR